MRTSQSLTLPGLSIGPRLKNQRDIQKACFTFSSMPWRLLGGGCRPSGPCAFHEKADPCQEFFSFRNFFLFPRSSKPPLSPPFHPHSLLSDYRSVQVGCTRFSRCCYLIIDLGSPFRRELVQALSQSPDLGGRARLFGYHLSLSLFPFFL